MTNIVQFNAIEPHLMETHLIITQVLDADSILVQNKFNKKEKEIRLYGLDAPENKVNRKLKEDEKKTHIAGEFLVQLGVIATNYVLTIAPPGTNISLITETKYYYDYYSRQLAYIILPDGTCLNETLISEGYAKAMSEYYCSNLSKYQELNFLAKQSGKGLYALSTHF